MKITKITPSEKPVEKDAINLVKGDVITNPRIGDQIFIEFKRGCRSYVTQSVSDGKMYRTRVSYINNLGGNKVTVIGKAEFEKVASEIDKLRKSPKGTLFVINNRKTAELFRFKSFSPSGKIIAENPLNGNGFTIASSFTIKLVSSIEDTFHI